MVEKGIGTDGTLPTHIGKICKRNYAKVILFGNYIIQTKFFKNGIYMSAEILEILIFVIIASIKMRVRVFNTVSFRVHQLIPVVA